MKLAPPSEAKLRQTLARPCADTAWDLPRDWAESLYNYLVYGLDPGGFIKAALAGDFHQALQRCLPANSIAALKRLSIWIVLYAPHPSRGSFETVDGWLAMDDSERREWLERTRLINTEQEDTFLMLKNVDETKE